MHAKIFRCLQEVIDIPSLLLLTTIVVLCLFVISVLLTVMICTVALKAENVTEGATLLPLRVHSIR